jgi:hypothetical protein
MTGMDLVCSYLSHIDWAGFPLDLLIIKLDRLATELYEVVYAHYHMVVVAYLMLIIQD